MKLSNLPVRPADESGDDPIQVFDLEKGSFCEAPPVRRTQTAALQLEGVKLRVKQVIVYLQQRLGSVTDAKLHQMLTFGTPFDDDDVLRQVFEEVLEGQEPALVDFLMLIAIRGEVLSTQAKMAQILMPKAGDLSALTLDPENLAILPDDITQILSVAAMDIEAATKPVTSLTGREFDPDTPLPADIAAGLQTLTVLQGGTDPQGDES